MKLRKLGALSLLTALLTVGAMSAAPVSAHTLGKGHKGYPCKGKSCPKPGKGKGAGGAGGQGKGKGAKPPTTVPHTGAGGTAPAAGTQTVVTGVQGTPSYSLSRSSSSSVTQLPTTG